MQRKLLPISVFDFFEKFQQNASKSYIKHSTKMIKRKRQHSFHCKKYGNFSKCFVGMVGLALTLKCGGVNAERCYKWEKKSLMHCNVVDQHLKGLGRLIRWRTTTLGPCHLTLNIWKKEKKYYLWVKNRLPLSRSIRTSPNDLSHQSVFVYQDRRAAIISLNFFSFFRF